MSSRDNAALDREREHCLECGREWRTDEAAECPRCYPSRRRPLTRLEREIVSVFSGPGPGSSATGLDHSLLWNGYVPDASAEAVAAALRYLRGRGILETTTHRGWYRLAGRHDAERNR